MQEYLCYLSMVAFDLQAVFNALALMGKGMIGIFIVMASIFLLIAVLNYMTKPKDTEIDFKGKE